MATIQQEQINRFFQILAASKLPSELTELLQAPTNSQFIVIQTGSEDAKKINVSRVRGALGNYNASSNSPFLSNGSATEGDSYLVTATGTVDFGNGNVSLPVNSVVTYLNGQWRKAVAQSYVDGQDTIVLQSAKEYTDSFANGLKWKNSVTVATTANITLTGEQTIDGILTAASRVLVKDQTTATENGIYLSGAGAWIRTADADTGTELVSATVSVDSGTANDNKKYNCNNDAITLGTTNIIFVSIGNTIDHNSTTGKQGGQAGEYFHLKLAERDKLTGIDTNANNYEHPTNHPPSIITQDTSNRFVTDTEKATWNAKETPTGAQAKADAKVQDVIVDGVIDKAPSQNAVFDALALKVDKITGKGLSTNDYTTTEKNKLASITAIFTTALKAAYDSASSWVSTNGANVLNHLGLTNNPHSVTAAQVGLSNVDNTSDAAKPVSTAQLTALNAKVDDSQVLTNVPLNALFTDTIYNDTAIQAEVTDNTNAKHSHLNKPTLDKFGENISGLPTYNGVKVDTTIAQRDVYDGLDSLDNTISLSANNGKVLKDVQVSQQTAINLNTAKETNIAHPLVETAVPVGAVFTDTIYDDADVVKSVNGLTPDAAGAVTVGSSLLSKSFTYTSGAQTITADFDIVQVSSLAVGNSFLQEGTQYTVSGAVVTILDTLTSGAVIQLKYWKANAVNAVSYTKAESDAQFAKSIEISQEGWQSLKDAGTLENAFYFTT